MEIRPAQEADADLSIAFLRVFRAEELDVILQHHGVPTREEQKEFIRSHDGKSGVMLLCIKAEKIVGILTVRRRSHPQLEHACEFGMGVLREERGRGVGSALVHQLFDWALLAGISRIELSVADHNTGAIRLYQKLGFQIEGRKVKAMKVSSRFVDIIEMVRVAVVRE